MRKILIVIMVLITLFSVPVHVYGEETITPVLISQPAAEEESEKDEIEKIDVYFGETEIRYDVKAKLINGITYIPLRFTLEEMGYTVNWIEMERSVEVYKGAQWTKLYIDKNSYTKNRMAPVQLSSAPVIINGRTMVPAEFYHEILNLVFSYEEEKFMFIDNDMDTLITHRGYLKKISNFDNSAKYYLADNNDGEVSLIINISRKNTLIQNDISEGDIIKVISPPVMALSYPGQTQGIIVYK